MRRFATHLAGNLRLRCSVKNYGLHSLKALQLHFRNSSNFVLLAVIWSTRLRTQKSLTGAISRQAFLYKVVNPMIS